MAQSGSIDFILIPDKYKLVLDWSQDSSDPATNQSTVSWSISFVKMGTAYAGYVSSFLNHLEVLANGGWVFVDELGEEYGKVTATEPSMTIASRTNQHLHNSNGSLDIVWKIIAKGPGASGTKIDTTQTATITLDPIDRIAQITSVKEFNDETNPVLSYYNPTKETNLSLMIDVEDKYGDLYSVVTKTIAAGVESGEYTVSFTTAQRNTIREYSKDTKSANLRFRLYSTAGYKDSTYSCPIINADPTFSFSVVDTDSETIRLTGNSNKIIKGYSNPKVTVSASGKKYATISAIGVTCGDDSHTVTNLSSFNHTFENVAADKIFITVVDSRGKRNVLDTTFGDNIIDYTPLGCVLEVDSVDFTDDETVTTNFKVSGPYFNQSFGSSPNSLRASYRYKLGTNDWVDWISFTPTKTTKSYSAIIPVESAYTDAVEIEVNISDALVSQIQSYKNIATPVFDWGENDFAFNVPVVAHSDLEVDGTATFNDVTIKGAVPLCIVESGKSGIWEYRKYSDGTAECWGVMILAKAVNKTWGSLYTTGRIDGQSFPFTFNGMPICTISLNGGYAGGWIMRSGDSATPTDNTNTGSYEIVRGGSSTLSSSSFTVTFYARGKWK